MIRYLINQFIISSFLYIGKIDELDYSVLSIFWESKEIDGVQNAMLSKLNELAEGKKKTFDDDNNTEDAQKKMEDIFIKRGVGKPRGTPAEKQQQYLTLWNQTKSRTLCKKTLDYYQACKDEKGQWIINKFQE